MESRSETSTTVEQTRSIPSLDGLRGIAVLLVIAAHMGWFELADKLLLQHHLRPLAWLAEIDGGDLGVSIFFVISGFLITTLLIRKEDANGRVSLKNFYVRRFFRIFPPYYFYLAVVGVLWGAHLVPMLRGAWLTAALYVSNYYPYRLSQPATDGWLVGHTWSLSLEEQFYLLWPVCLYWLRRRGAAWLGIGLLLLGPAARLLTLHLAPGSSFDGQIDRMFHTRIDTIMAGCVLALLGSWPGAHRWLLRGGAAPWTAWLAIVLLFSSLHASWANMQAQQIAGIGLEAVLLAYLVWYMIRNAHGWAGRLLNHPWLRHLGLISYSLYLWQQMFDGPVKLLPGPRILRLPLIFVAAEFSYRVVEKGSYSARDRFIAWRERRMAAETAVRT